VLASFAVAVVGLGVFARQTTHHASPVIDPALLRVRAFSWANVATLVFNTGFGVSLLGGILWMQQVWDYSALRTGFAIALGPLLVPITSIVSQRLFSRSSASRLVTAGSLVSALGAGVMAVSVSTSPSYWTTFLPGWALMGVAVGLVMPNLIAAATSTLPPEQASTGGGVISMSRQLGLVLGVSVLVSIFAGSAAPVDKITSAWLVVVGVSLVAAVAAFAMETTRRTTVVVEPAVSA
jgi:MFS family permease